MIKFESQYYVVNDFKEWQERGELVLSPKFQRRLVWSDKGRSFLIDTILRGFPISKIFIRHDVNPKTRKSIREIVDGQQRLSAILLYLNDGFKVSASHNSEFGGKFFSELPERVQLDVLGYRIAVDTFLGASDAEVLDIFGRLNSYTVPLNKQELLNAKYVGLFKQMVYSLGHEFVDYWLINGVFTQGQVARMGEAELASEMVIFLVDGTQDRNRISTYYQKFDEEFNDAEKITIEFRKTMDSIATVLQEWLRDSQFSSKPLFYSLFCVFNELGKENKLTPHNYSKISSALQNVDEILSRQLTDVPSKAIEFYEASTKHVTDTKSRKLRHEFIKSSILANL